MQIGILSRNPKLVSTRRLVEAAQARDHETQVLDVFHGHMTITSHGPSIHLSGEELTEFDAVISVGSVNSPTILGSLMR